MALTIATVISVISQLPAGMWVDAAGPKRRPLIFGAVVIIGVTPLVLAELPRTLPVLLALGLQAAAGTLLSPAIAALSLARVGQDGLAERLGRNARYGSIGAGLGAAIMGAVSTWISASAVFLTAFAMLPLALLAIARIGPDRFAPVPDTADAGPSSVWMAPVALIRDHRVVIFAASLGLFQLASIAVLQLAAVDITAREGARSGLIIAAFVIVPQVIVAIVSPSIGRWTTRHGRKAVLVPGFATTALRALAFAAIRGPGVLITVQALEGAGGAVFGIMMPLIAADLTRGTRRYTSCLGLLGLAGTAGAALSTLLGGFVADRFGQTTAFVALAAAGGVATLVVALALPETHSRGG
jgi:MFS family permease